MKAIETVYKGYKFRSRLEARWAVFFDALGIEYQYEHEGHNLDGIWYLPDFWIKQWSTFVEIKPDTPSADEIWKCCELAEQTSEKCLLIFGQPWIDEYKFHRIYGHESVGENRLLNVFAECRRCDGINYVIDDEGGYGSMGLCCDAERWPSIDSLRLLAAYTAARQARFEQGR